MDHTAASEPSATIRLPRDVYWQLTHTLARALPPPAAEDAQALEQSAARGCDLALAVGDGLSSLAVQRHAPAVLAEISRLAPPDWRISPIVIATQGRSLYIVDRANTGMHILELTGAARRLANFPEPSRVSKKEN